MNLRMFGVVTMITAPAMTVEAARHGFAPLDNAQTDVVGALLYGAFALGWWCALYALFRLRAAGTGRWGRAVTAAPLFTIALALLQTPADIFGLDQQSPLYAVVDLAWPLSMLLTFAVGVAAAFARRLPGAYRWVPLFAGSSVPLAALLGVLGLSALPQWIFDVHVIVGWVLLGCVAFGLEADKKRPAPLHDVVTPSTGAA